MSELEDKISGILSNPAQMEQIAQIAKSLMGGAGTEPAPPADVDATAAPAQSAPDSTAESATPPADGLPSLGGLDPSMLAGLGKLMSGGGSGGSDKTALLNAMAPYLSQKRRDKLSRAVQLAKMAKIAGAVWGSQKDGT